MDGEKSVSERSVSVKLGGMNPNAKFHNASIFMTMDERMMLFKILSELQQEENIRIHIKDLIRIMLRHPEFKKFLKEAYEKFKESEQTNGEGI